MVTVWSIHGYPDLYFRTASSAIVAAVASTIGGAVVGIFYGFALRFVCGLLKRAIRPRVHFYWGVLLAFSITAVLSELRYRALVNIQPSIACFIVVVCLFVLAISTAKGITPDDVFTQPKI